MKTTKTIVSTLALIAFLATPFIGKAEDNKEKSKPYPLDTCVVSGDKLGDMGAPYIYMHEGREVRFCCKSCVKDFKKNPAKYLKKIDDAEQNAKK